MRPSALALGALLAAACAAAAAAQDQTDAISREFTVWVDNLANNPPITDALSREFTVYVGNQPLRPQTDAVTREFTVFVDSFAGPGGITDAITREFTVYVGTQPLRPQTDAVTREFTVFVDDAPPQPTDAIAREFTVYIGTQPLREQTDCVTREFTAFVGEYLLCPTWTELTDGPAAASYGLAYDSHRGVAVLFYRSETWEWDGQAWTRRDVPGPAERRAIAMAYDQARGEVVLFGGSLGASTYSDETWVWDGNRWTQLFPTLRPPARSSFAMEYDAERQVVVLFGGRNASDLLGDTWEWDGTTWAHRDVPGPEPRFGAAMSYDASRGVMVLFGGGTGTFYDPEFGDTWEYDGTAWTLRATEGPSPRQGAATAFADEPRVVVLHGGADYVRRGFGGTILDIELFSDIWAWNGASWIQQAAVSPAGNAYHRMVPAGAPGHMTVHGGTEVVQLFGDPFLAAIDGTHRLAAGLMRPGILEQPSGQSVEIGGTATFAVAAYGGPVALGYQWRRDGNPLVNGPSAGGGVISGATSETLSIANIGAADAGRYDVLATNQCGTTASAIAVLALTGDLNCDGAVNNFDIDPFVLAISDPEGYSVAYPNCSIDNADVNHDGAVNNFDIDVFVQLISGG